MISTLYSPARFSSHSVLRLAMARKDLGDMPATYNRRCQTSSPSATPTGDCWLPSLGTDGNLAFIGDTPERVGPFRVGTAHAALLGALAGSILDTGRTMEQQTSDDVG